MGNSQFLIRGLLADIIDIIALLSQNGALCQFDNPAALPVADQKIRAGLAAQGLGLGLCKAAADRDNRVRVFTPGAADLLPALLRAGAGHGTGVNDIDIGGLFAVNDRIAGL